MNTAVKIACIGALKQTESNSAEIKTGQSKFESGSTVIAPRSFDYSGDTLTTAIYLARSGLPVSLISVVKESSIESACQFLQQEKLNTNLVISASSGSFFSSDDLESIRQQLVDFDYVYLTGNTLALLDEQALDKLVEILVVLRKGGGKVVFDSNHNNASWGDAQIARTSYEKFMQVTDISLPGFTAEADLFNDSGIEELIARQHAFGISEIAVKNGIKSNWLSTKPDKPPREFPLESVQSAVDHSGAGDAFNAAYLATRLSGKTYCGSIKQGQLLAAAVVLAPGAILEKS